MWWVLSVSLILPANFVVTLGQTDLCSASLDLHNEYRAKHGSSPFTCSDEISEVAQAYADELGQSCTTEHSNTTIYGENLYIIGSTSDYMSADIAVNEAVKSWYSGEVCYDYKDPKPNSCQTDLCWDCGAAGEFTQVVWKNTTEVGVGVSFCEDTDGGVWYTTIVVANYLARGNVEAEFDVNVQPKN